MKKALTIGELLIAMTIIGVIAMLVLPGFLRDYHKKLYVTKLKKTYETIEIAIAQACNDDNVSYFYQTQYSKNPSGSNGQEQQKFIDKYFKLSTVDKTNPLTQKYRTISSEAKVATGLGSSGFGRLVTGEAIAFWCSSTGSFCLFRIDINADDGPNTGGRDVFTIGLHPEDNTLYEHYNPKNCFTSKLGEGCFQMLLDSNWEMLY